MAGVKFSDSSLPYAVWSWMGQTDEFAIAVNSFANSSGSNDLVMTSVVHSRIKDGELGGYNRSTFVNPEPDKLIEQAAREMDPKKNEAPFQKTAKLALEDGVFTPIFFIGETTAVKRGLSFTARTDRHIYAMNIRPTELAR